MQTRLVPEVLATPAGRDAEAILRSCVHCGFCNATCPTYQLRGDELDGPRGRIYLVKQMLEGAPPTASTALHLDRCLTCLACETTCPSGVRYHHLAEYGRAAIEAAGVRPWHQRVARAALRAVLPHRNRLRVLLAFGRALRPVLPARLAVKLPRPVPRARPVPAPRHARRLLLLEGCVQPLWNPNIDAAARRVFDRLGVSLLPVNEVSCCGAIHHHNGDGATAKAIARRNIDAWWPAIEAGADGILITASGCGAHIKDYGHLLADDAAYADKAARVSALAQDPAGAIAPAQIAALHLNAGERVAFHAPCTLQHALRLGGRAEALLKAAGFELAPVADAHLCCGSAGTYALLQPALATALRDRKLAALGHGNPTRILTANIGCLAHLQAGTALPIVHWLEAIDSLMAREGVL